MVVEGLAVGSSLAALACLSECNCLAQAHLPARPSFAASHPGSQAVTQSVSQTAGRSAGRGGRASGRAGGCVGGWANASKVMNNHLAWPPTGTVQ